MFLLDAPSDSPCKSDSGTTDTTTSPPAGCYELECYGTARPQTHEDNQYTRYALSERPKPDSQLWFDNGNVVIAAGHTYFRVHADVLLRNANMFLAVHHLQVPHSAQTATVLVSDSAHDLKHLLHIFYDGFDYLERTDGPTKFGHHAAAARLAQKYDALAVLDRVTVCLRAAFFPATFDLWAQHEQARAERHTMCPEDALEAVNLFRALGWNDMLPAALYICASQLAPGTLLRGHPRADGTLEGLSTDDAARCVALQRTLVGESAAMAAALYALRPGKTCRNDRWFASNTCKATLVAESASRVQDTGALSGDPLGGHLRGRIAEWEDKGSVCAECARALREREDVLRREFWSKLPALCV
ncbi:hypothetical protein C8Q80DRAFT_1253789 [Daedaleopsis nitida]|nr:hypothetical protein C8Q80DRAFT_1253789 [Daedaleopsis nitida]